MFVTKWSPGIQQIKPELEMVPVWLEFTGVPLQFFNKDALKEIAMVGHPLCLHPATENLTNIEVAKVYTVIDPRKPLPEFVNARFECGDTRRIAVTSPWLPSLCSFCKKFGHTITRCKHALKTCLTCNSVKHPTALCPRTNHSVADKEKHEKKEGKKREGKKPIKSLLPIVGQPAVTTNTVDPKNAKLPAPKRTAGTHKEKPADAPAYKEILTSSLSPSIADIAASPGSQDLSAEGCFEDHQQTSTGSSGSFSDIPLSEEDDNPSDDEDEFIEFFSKRHKKRAKANARARGSLIL
ncbi:uncharacterized protein LOC125585776 [Brassica napus]|uniref:uncharacterized protein LOC125585776 n=1 Tax=Brassica napus TaxID=3708 RepID=UPI00207A5E72|nr:uncharacterized protein LOC125585776 [Brassica napus]